MNYIRLLASYHRRVCLIQNGKRSEKELCFSVAPPELCSVGRTGPAGPEYAESQPKTVVPRQTTAADGSGPPVRLKLLSLASSVGILRSRVLTVSIFNGTQVLHQHFSQPRPPRHQTVQAELQGGATCWETLDNIDRAAYL